MCKKDRRIYIPGTFYGLSLERRLKFPAVAVIFVGLVGRGRENQGISTTSASKTASYCATLGTVV